MNNEQNEMDEYRELRAEIAEENGGIVIEGTDSGENMAAAMFQPPAVTGPIVTIASRGIPQDDGGTEHGQPTVESHERLVPGAELRSDTNNYARRLRDFAAEHPDFDSIVGREDVLIPISVQRTVLRLPNGPAFAFYLGQHPEVAEDLSAMDPFDAAVAARGMARALENDEIPRDVSTYAEYRAAMNRHEVRRQAARRRNG